MNKKKILTILSFIFVCAFFFSVGNKIKADNIEFNMENDIPSYFVVGDTLTVPKGSFNNEASDSYVYFPSGNVSILNEVKLTEHGKYTIRYIKKINNKTCVKDVSFEVKNPLYTLSGVNTTSTYQEKNSLTQRSGLLLKLKEGETVTFTKPINLNDYTYSNTPFKFTIVPSKIGSFDAKKVVVTFTDAYDPNNKIEFTLFMDQDPLQTPWNDSLSKANGQSQKGWDYTGSEPKIWTNIYGMFYEISPFDSVEFSGRKGTNIFATQYVGCYVNPQNNEGYIEWFSFLNGYSVSGLCNDYDDASYQEELFEGFKTGEVFVSIKASEFQTPECNLQILKVGDIDLSSNIIVDDVSPIVEVYDDDLEHVGSSTLSYPISKVEAYDSVSGILLTNVNVYYEYDREDGEYNSKSSNYEKEIAVVNGRFNTLISGKYSIVYSAEDYQGNYTEKVVNINVTDNKENIINVVMDDSCVTSIEANNILYLAKVKSYQGGYKDVSVTYEVKCGDTKEEILGNKMNGYYFIPKKAGKYTVSVILRDYLYNESVYEYTVDVKEQTNPSFTKEINLPKYIAKNTNYILPDYIASYNGSSVVADINITTCDGTFKYDNGKEISFTSGDEVTIAYSFNGNKKEYTIPLIDIKDEYIHVDKYFISESLTVSKVEDGVLVKSEGKGNTGSFEFFNSLLANIFTVNFTVTSYERNSEITIYLTDEVNENEKIKLTIKNINNENNVYLNDVLAFKKYTSNVVNKSFNVSYDAESKALYIGESDKINIRNTMYGEEFTGFSSKKVYLSGELVNKTAIKVTKIINQDLNQISEQDNRFPSLTLDGRYGVLLKTKGDLFDIYSAVSGDVLSPYVKADVSFEFNFEPVKSVDGTVLSAANCNESYVVKFEEYGEYTLTYKVTDWAKKVYYYSLIINVVDLDKPELIIDGKIPKTASVGKITLPKISAKDNECENPSIVVTVIKPENVMSYVGQEKKNSGVYSFEADKSGEYQLFIMVFDDFGNVTESSYVINVR